MTDSPPVELTLTRLRMYFRDPGAVFWSFGFPVLLSLALGYAFRSRPTPAPVVAVEPGPGAQELAGKLRASGRVTLRDLAGESSERALGRGTVDVVVSAGSPRSYAFEPTRIEGLLARNVVDDVLQRAEGRIDPTATRDVAVLLPGHRYIDFLLPGLVGMNLMSNGMWGIGYVIVELRTRKLLRRLVATPMRKRDFLFSFVLFRLLFLVFELPVLLGFGHFALGMPIAGSLLLTGVVALCGSLAFAGIGLLVASRAPNNQTAAGLINLVTMPMFVFSGVFFSTSRFPEAAQRILRWLPLSALNDALRAVITDGAGARAVAPQLGLLLGVAALSFVAALRLFRWQ